MSAYSTSVGCLFIGGLLQTLDDGAIDFSSHSANNGDCCQYACFSSGWIISPCAGKIPAETDLAGSRQTAVARTSLVRSRGFFHLSLVRDTDFQFFWRFRRPSLDQRVHHHPRVCRHWQLFSLHSVRVLQKYISSPEI
jgi:hypothetical protein